MQYSLKVFETEDHWGFRVIDQDGKPWFVLADVCRAIQINNPSDAARRLDDDEKMTLDLTEGQSGVRGGARKMNLVNESGLYSLVIRSDKPEAKRFRKWVTSEVLPSIRKTGAYGGKPIIPRFVIRANENWNRVDVGHFSVINELFARLYGRFEVAGYVLADRAPDGTENRPDVSVGRTLSAWLQANHPHLTDSWSYYPHKTAEWEGPARQYPNTMLHLYIEFVETVWIPKYAEGYFKPRDPAALPYLAKVLPSLTRPKPGMVRSATANAFKRPT